MHPSRKPREGLERNLKIIRRILFAVRKPEGAHQPGLAKAIQVARAFGARLELFHAMHVPVFEELSLLQDDTVDKLRERVEEQARLPLARMCAQALKHGVQAEYRVAWDYPPHEAILRRAAANGADLIIAECHKGGRTRPWLIHLTDWELLRTSPLPVLLFKNDKPYRRPLTLAAVDPARAHAKPRTLDADIVAGAREFSKALRGALHLGHANYPTIAGLPHSASTKDRKWTTLSYEQLQEQEREAFEAFRVEMQVLRTRAHLVTGNPASVIPRLARGLGAQVVVMGALSRSGLMRVLIGNTAERVLEALPCDVLVVKPDGVEPHVGQEARGMRVVQETSAPMAP
jgi:universal stress protein E